MKERQRRLLKMLLLQEEGAVQIKDLAKELQCAEKTVRNDLDRLEVMLEEFPSANLIRQPGLGISIQIGEQERTEIMQILLSNDSKTLEERLFEIAFQLLISDKPLTLSYWADRYYVPKSTIKKDMETISNWLHQFELELISKQRLGNVILGTELNKRNALAHLPELIPSFSNEKHVVLDLFLPYEIYTVKKALQDVQNYYAISFTDDALDSLLVHALIMVKRVRQGSSLYMNQDEIASVKSANEYHYANSFFTQLEEAFKLTFPLEEKVYFTWHFISAKRLEEGMEDTPQHMEETISIVESLVEKMDKLTLFPFQKDQTLRNGLAVHMHSVINRIRYGFPITNPLLSNIKKMYPYMFSMVILSLEKISRNFHINIPEDEAAYILLHFQASIERMKGKKKLEKKSVLIVCHMGIGMAHLLEAKLEKQYEEIDVVATIGRNEVVDYLKENSVDFIITTVPLDEVNVESIVVSPLFGDTDKKNVNEFIQQQNSAQKKGSFSSFLKEDLLFFQTSKSHRYEVVEKLAMTLYEKGYVKKEFIHSAMNREQKSATAIGGGIAIPHGDPAFIERPVVAVAVFKEPISWGEELVSIVFLLAMTKENQAVLRELIGKIAALSENPLAVHKLTETKDFHQFLDVLDNL